MSADFFASNLSVVPVAAPPPPAAPSLARAGMWHLRPDQALSLRPVIDRELYIASGRVWVTLHAAQASAVPYQLPEGEWVWPRPQTPLGDQVLQAGDRLWVPAGSHLVMEAWPLSDEALPVHFDWVAVVGAVVARGRFEQEVVMPLHASLRAWGQAASACMRGVGLLLSAVWGLLRYSEYLVPRRGQVLSDLESCRS